VPIELPATVYDDNGICYYISEDGVCSVQKGVDEAEVIIPQEIIYSGKAFTVTEIGVDAFYNFDNLTSIELPSSIKSIGNYAFQDCDSLKTIVIPDSVSYIGRYAFDWCQSLSKINIPDGITSIENGTFLYCQKLDSITIPNSVTTIGDYAFSDCYSLDSITIPNSVTTIGDYAFEDCYRITTVSLPDSLIDIGRYAFAYCSRMAALEIPQSVTTLGNFAFYDCYALNSVVVPKSVTTIGDGCFACCYNLKEIQVESENRNYQSIDGVLFNKDLTTLCWYPGGKEGDHYKVPNSVTMIDTIALCSRLLQTVQIPAATSRIRGNVFRYSSQLKAIEVAAGNENYQSVDGILFDKGLTTLYVYPRQKEGTEYTIPSSVTSIEEYAFYNANLESIKIPEAVTNIGKYAFDWCRELSNIELPNSLISIGQYAFAYCYGLSAVTIPESVTSIGYDAFQSCSNLKCVEIKSSVATVGSYAFYGCDSLTDVVCYATEPITTPYYSWIFSNNTYASATLYVPEEAIAAYQSSYYCWSQFENIKPLSQYTDIQAVTLSGESTAPAVIYDLNGARVYKELEHLAPGIYVVHQGDKSHKVLIK
jgi:hypothetical protein